MHCLQFYPMCLPVTQVIQSKKVLATSDKSISNAAQIGDLAIVTLRRTVTKKKCNAYGFI